jgi:hypothetical protein
MMNIILTNTVNIPNVKINNCGVKELQLLEKFNKNFDVLS